MRYKLGRLEDAHATYREIAGAAPHDAGARRNLGLLALKLERIDEALPELEMAVRIAPGDTRAWSYLGYAYAKKGEVVQAAAAFRRAGQDALANELDQAAKVQRPPTPVARGGSEAAPRRPVALAPPLPPMTPPMPPAVAAEKRPPSWKEPRARRPEIAAPRVSRRRRTPSGPPTSSRRSSRPRRARSSRCRCWRSCWRGSGRRRRRRSRRARSGWRSPTRPTRAPTPSWPARARSSGSRASGARRGGSAASRWGARAGRRSSGSPGGGEIWVAGAADRWLPLRLADDVLYVREDRVLAFEGVAGLGGGRRPEHGAAHAAVPRARHGGAASCRRDAIAIKVTDETPTLLSAARLFGWVGRLVPHGARMPGAAPFQLGCQGEGVVLLEAPDRLATAGLG